VRRKQLEERPCHPHRVHTVARQKIECYGSASSDLLREMTPRSFTFEHQTRWRVRSRTFVPSETDVWNSQYTEAQPKVNT